MVVFVRPKMTKIILDIIIVFAILIEQMSAGYNDWQDSKSVPSAQESVEVVPAISNNFCYYPDEYPLACLCSAEEQPFTHCFIYPVNSSSKQTNREADQKMYNIEYLKFEARLTPELTIFPVNVIKPLVNLKSFFFNFGAFKELPSYALSNHTYLRQITLNNNKIVKLMPFSISNHPQLQSIDLSYNEINSFDRNTFSKLESLMHLNFAHNYLKQLNDSCFEGLESLEYLDFENNHLESIELDAFKRLGKLNTLVFTSNKFAVLGPSIFSPLWSLLELNLDDNELEDMSERVFDGLVNLKNLTLRYNYLEQLVPTIFNTAPGLDILDLAMNSLRTITYEHMLPLWDNFVNKNATLNLNGNKLLCDCRLNWIFELHNLTKNQLLQDYLKKLVCIFEQDLVISNAGRNKSQENNQIKWNSFKEIEISQYNPTYHTIMGLDPKTWPCPIPKMSTTSTTEIPESQLIDRDSLSRSNINKLSVTVLILAMLLRTC